MRTLPFAQFVIGTFALVIFITSIQLYGGVGSYGAGFMPTILSALLFFFTLLDGIVHCVQRPQKIPFSAAEWRAVAIVMVVVGLFCLFVSNVGFPICSFVLLLTLMSLRNPKKWLLNGVCSLVASGLIYYLFAKVLMVALPAGFFA